MTQERGAGRAASDRPGSSARPQRRIALPSGSGILAACALVHAIGQVGNLLFQIMLARRFGLAAYGEIGLAHLLFVLVCFVGDLGYSSMFLRENPSEPSWSRHWRMALGHKLVATLALYAAALAGWAQAYGVDSRGFAYLLAVFPAALFALFVAWPPLLARGRRLTAFCVQQVSWPAALILWMLFAGEAPSVAEAGAGVSAGFAVQLALSVAVWKRPSDLLPVFAWGGRMLHSAFSLSAIAIAGAAHDRLTPFLLQRLAPEFLPVLLLLGHGLNGVSGVVAQINRLLLPQIASAAGLRWSLRLAAVALAGTALLLQALLCVGLLWPRQLAELSPQLLLPTFVAWGIATTSGFAAVEMIGARREGLLARILVAGIVVSAVLQFAAMIAASAEGVVWARALCLLGIAGASLRASGIAPGFAGWILCAATASAALVPHATWLWPVSGILLATAAACMALGGAILVRRDDSRS